MGFNKKQDELCNGFMSQNSHKLKDRLGKTLAARSQSVFLQRILKQVIFKLCYFYSRDFLVFDGLLQKLQEVHRLQMKIPPSNLTLGFKKTMIHFVRMFTELGPFQTCCVSNCSSDNNIFNRKKDIHVKET